MDALIGPNAAVVALAATALSVVSLVFVILMLIRQQRLLKRYRLILSGETGRDLESLLLSHATDIETLQGNVAAIERQLSAVERNGRLHIQKTAIIRYNAFPDTGSDLSFSVALLDAYNNGFVITSLYGRQESRTYAKPIQDGKSTYTLSDDEKNVIAKAMGTNN